MHYTENGFTVYTACTCNGVLEAGCYYIPNWFHFRLQLEITCSPTSYIDLQQEVILELIFNKKK